MLRQSLRTSWPRPARTARAAGGAGGAACSGVRAAPVAGAACSGVRVARAAGAGSEVASDGRTGGCSRAPPRPSCSRLAPGLVHSVEAKAADEWAVWLLVAAVVEGVLVILVTTAEEVSLSTAAEGAARAFAKSLGVD
eukprot:scaffold8212_cov59-Phaeocystis_antarctica.AAC.2